MKKIIVILLTLVLNGNFVYGQTVVEKLEDSIAVYLNKYRKELNLKEFTYIKEFNPIIREWGEDFAKNRMKPSYFTLDLKNFNCIHFLSKDRHLELNKKEYISHLGFVSEIAFYVENYKKINENDAKFDVEGWKKSQKHNERIIDTDFNYISIGVYYDEISKIEVCYVYLFEKIVCK